MPVGAAGGLVAIDPSVMSDYLRRRVLHVEALHGRNGTGGDIGGDIGAGIGRGVPPQPDRHSRPAAWRIHFEDGLYADVRLQPVGVTGSAFPDLQSRFYAQQDQWGDPASSSDIIARDAVGCVDISPYETYFQGGLLVSREWQHEAVVEASSVASPNFRETMAGIAVLALRLLGD